MITKNRFPLIFGRKGGATLSILKGLNSCYCDNYILKIIKLSDEISTVKKDLLDNLHLAISEEEYGKEKKSLLNLKRDLYNDKGLEKHLALANKKAIQRNFNKYLNKQQLYLETKHSFKLI